MIRVELTNPNTPNEIIAQAKRFGGSFFNSNKDFDHLAIQDVGGIYYFEGRKIKDIAVIKVIDLTNGNFIAKPRINGINDGYDTEGIAVGSGGLQYPLEDTLNTSAIVGVKNDEVELSRDAQLFGNIDWIGKNTANEGEPSDAPILTWKGPTGRTLPCDTYNEITGLSTFDVVFENSTTQRYTCFGPYIYEHGDILAEAPAVSGQETDTPTKVLGAAYTSYNDSLILVCIVNNHYASLDGFYEEVWVLKDEWTLLNSRRVGRPTLCWFFNQSGTRATQANTEYILNFDNNTAQYIQETSDSIIMNIDKENNKTTFSGSSVVWSDYKGDTRVFATLNASGGHKRASSDGGYSKTTQAPIYVEGASNFINVQLEIQGSSAVLVESLDQDTPSLYSIPACCSEPVLWEGVGLEIDAETGLIGKITGCAKGAIIANKCGVRLEFPCLLPDGAWTLVSATNYGDGAFGTGTLYTNGSFATITGISPYEAGSEPMPEKIYASGGCLSNVVVTSLSEAFFVRAVDSVGPCSWAGFATSYGCNVSHGYPSTNVIPVTPCPDNVFDFYNCISGQNEQIRTPEPFCQYMHRKEVYQWQCITPP